MPLIGIVDPSHSMRAEDAPGRWPRWLSVEELLETARVADPKWSPWTFELVNAAVQQHQERTYVSTSLLTGGCLRGSLIERKMDYIGSLDQSYAALRGTMVHRTMEYAAREGALAEWRFGMTVDDTILSCSPDLLTFGPGAIWDYKHTENPPNFGYAYRHHTEQVQLNRFIVNHAEWWKDSDGNEDADLHIDPRDVTFEHCVIVYMGPKGPKVIESEKSVERTTPNGRKVKRKVPYVWSDDEVIDWLRPRLDAWKLAFDAFPDWPEGLEKAPGWAGGPDWRCPGPPICNLPNCTAKRFPYALTWENPR